MTAREQEAWYGLVMRARRTSVARLRFSVEAWEQIADDLGLRTDAERAQFLGVDPSNYHRITRGQSHPSESFVARVMKALQARPDATFERLFPIVDKDAEAEPAA